MKKYFMIILSSLSFLGAILCGVSYNVIGSEVAADGTLIEPFYLIPMSYLFAAIGVIFAIIFFVSAAFRKSKSQ